jgi:hypothetical protein
MKRSPLPGRSAPLARRTAPKARKRWPDPTKPKRPVKRESDKRIAERPARAAVREEALRRAGYRCQLRDIVPEIACWHPAGEPLDCDEIAQRGVAPGGHLDVDNVQVACRAHHDWKTVHRIEAEARGVRMSGAEYERRTRPDR